MADKLAVVSGPTLLPIAGKPVAYVSPTTLDILKSFSGLYRMASPKWVNDEERVPLYADPVSPPPYWRCFHCDEVFYDAHSAKLHFGMDQCSDPACKIKMGAEGSLVKALRAAENELADAWAAIHNESTEAAKAYYAQQSRHGDQLRAAEEAGYERGLADGRAEGGLRIDTRETKCEICGGRHDNDVLTDICTSCEARSNEEGSP